MGILVLRVENRSVIYKRKLKSAPFHILDMLVNVFGSDAVRPIYRRIYHISAAARNTERHAVIALKAVKRIKEIILFAYDKRCGASAKLDSLDRIGGKNTESTPFLRINACVRSGS